MKPVSRELHLNLAEVGNRCKNRKAVKNRRRIKRRSSKAQRRAQEAVIEEQLGLNRIRWSWPRKTLTRKQRMHYWHGRFCAIQRQRSQYN